MRMSRGPSRRKLKPRSGGPSCSDETPRSKSRPATAPRSTPSSASTCSSRWKLPCASCARLPNGASRPAARRSASGSRSRPTSRAAGPRASSASACPPRPTVASTNSPPRSGASRSSDSRSSTGRCSTGVAADPEPAPAGAEGVPPSFKGPRPTAVRRASDPSLAQGPEVLFGEGLLLQAAGEAVAVPHHQVIEVGADHHLAAHAGALAQDLGDQQAPLVVQARLLAEVADPLEEARLHPVGGRHAPEPRLDLFPDRQRVEQCRFALDRGHEQLRSVPLLDGAAEVRRDLEPPLVVNLGWSTSAEHGSLPFNTVSV